MQMSEQETGCVFTPEKWADFAIERFGLIEKWIDGCTVLDPTMGNGELLLAMISGALKKGYDIQSLPVQRLYGVEINAKHFADAIKRLKSLCGANFNPDNFINDDVLFVQHQIKFDIVFANPPWVNYSALPDEYKEKIKSEYLKYGLVKSGASLLLGNSQVNLAALIIFSVVERMIKDNGEAVLFIPLSLVFHTGAHQAFTQGKVNSVDFCISEILDLAETDAFMGISTRFGLMQIFRNKKTTFPLNYFRFFQDRNEWKRMNVQPLYVPDGPWSVYEDGAKKPTNKKIKIPKKSKPRQGINTCGANKIYFFDKCESVDKKRVRIANSSREVIVESSVVYPMVHRTNFKENNKNIKKWVILPYHSDGKLFSESDLNGYPLLKKYFHSQRKELQSRRGKFLGDKISKGYYWTLLGVGIYNFWPHKIIWEAYGKRDFSPLIFEGDWQAGQALYAYLAFEDNSICAKVYQQLLQNDIEKVLNSLQLGGTMSWAQPGIISNFLEFE